jgi:pseudouridine-5'-phosphate glycosidase
MMITPSPAVAAALEAGRPLVALESTLICHGMPRPANAALAREMEQAVEAAGAVPATMAVLAGEVRAGLAAAELDRLAAAEDVAKCASRDLALAVARRGHGATTVSATIRLAARLGIQVMATGGLGGVHLGGAASLDISADLDELARCPVAVVCCGVKSILDQARTLERLETLGVPVVGFGTAELPGFYTAESGLAVPRLDELAELAVLVEAQHGLGLPGGVVVAVPPPAELALARDEVDGLVAAAQAAAERAGIRGPAQTPFMLRHMAEGSGGRTVTLNYRLAVANARLGGALACLLAERGHLPRPSEFP